MPAPSSQNLPPKPGARIRPALTQDDAANLPASELMNRGYPPRPDPQQAPGAFATSLKAVTKPATSVTPRLVPNPGVTHIQPQVTAGSLGSSNWSGYQLRGPANTYDDIIGTWYVPGIALPEANTATYSALWIGIDGFGTGDLVQEGTEQNLIQICFLGLCSNFSSYYAWSEFLPQQATEQILAGFNVYPNDEIFAQVQMCMLPATACYSQTGAPFAMFWIEDLTHPQSTVVYMPVGSTYVGGSQAEWIMERPTINGSLPDLATYVFAVMTGAYACNTEWYLDSMTCMTYLSPIKGATSQQILMYGNSGNVISVAEPLSSTEMEFFWQGFH